MRLRDATLAALLVGSLSAMGCDSSNDDDGMTPPPTAPGGGPAEGPDEVTDGGQMGSPDRSGDVAVIAARGATDEPYALDTAALATDLMARFGDATGEPLDIADGEDIVTVANRGR